MPQDLIFFIFGDFVLLVLFEILSRYLYSDGAHCFNEDIQWIIDKIFREKNYDLNGFNTSLSHFSTEFLDSACICFFLNS